MRAYISRLLIVFVLGLSACLGIYLLAQNPALFSVISPTVRSAPGWKKLSIKSPASFPVLAVNNGCAANTLYAVFGVTTASPASNPPGLYASLDSGATWSLVLDMRTYFVPQPDPQVLCGEGSEIVLVKTANSVLRIDTATKHLDTPAITESNPLESITSLRPDPSDNRIVYAAGNASSLWQSLDYGLTWKPLTGPTEGIEATITSLALDHQQPADLFVGTTAGLYRSSDQGTTWERTGKDLPLSANTRILAIEWDPEFPDQGYLLLGFNFTFETIIVKSSDGGASWSFSGKGPATKSWVTALKADHGSVFALTSSGLYRSTDQGTEWSTLDVPDLGQASGISSFRVDPATHDLYLITNRGLLISKDDGLSWSVLVSNSGPIVNSLSANGLYYAGSNEGIHFSGDEGASWTSRNNGLASLKIQVVQVHPSQPELVLAGTAEGKVFRSQDGGLNWKLAWASEDPVNRFLLNEQSPSSAYATTQAGELLRSRDLGETWDLVESPLSGQIRDGALSVDTLLVVSKENKLWQSRDQGSTWTEVKIDYPFSRIDDIAVKPGAVFAIIDGSTLLRSADGTSWQRTAAQPVRSGMQELLSNYDASPVLYLKTSRGLFFSESNGDAWQLALGDSSDSIHFSALDYKAGGILAVTDLNVLAGDPATIKEVQRESLTSLFFGQAGMADQVLALSQALQMSLGITLLILGGLLLCLLLLLLNIPFFLSFLWNTVEILFRPDQSLLDVHFSGLEEGQVHPFFFVVWSCVISFGMFFFSYWLSIPLTAKALATTSIFRFFTMDVFRLLPGDPSVSWMWDFFLTATLLASALVLYAAFNTVALKLLFRADEDLGWIFTQSFSFTCLIVSAWINILLLLSLVPPLAGFHSLFLVLSAIWFGILSVRFIYQVTSLSVRDSILAFGGTLGLPLVGLIYLAFLAYGYLRKWPWREAFRLLIGPITHFKTLLAYASGLVRDPAPGRLYLFAYAISLAPRLVFAALGRDTIAGSPLYSVWHDVWAVWLFPPLFATIAEIFAQWLNTQEFPTRTKKPSQIFGWTGTTIALILFFVSLNFWVRSLGVLILIALDDPTTKASVQVLYSLTVMARFVAMAFVVNQAYPNLLRTAATRIGRRFRELTSLAQIRDHWSFIRLTFTNPSAVLTVPDAQAGGSKPVNIFLLSVLLVVLAVVIDVLRALFAAPSLANVSLLPHRLFVVLLLVCVAVGTALIYSYLYLVDVLREEQRHRLFNSEGHLQILPGYVQVVELTLFVLGLFMILSSLIAFLSPPSNGRSGVILFLWAGFFVYASLIFAGIGRLQLEDFTFSRLFFRSIFQAMVAGLWGVLVWIAKALDPSTSNSMAIILEWQAMLLTRAQADVYFNRIVKLEKAKSLYRSVLEKSKQLKRLDFRDWNLPKDIMERYGLPFVFLPEPDVRTNALPLETLITSTLINLSTLDITEALNYINESMDDDAPETWERLPECREGSVHALAHILMENKELVVENIASLIPRHIPSQVMFEISDLLPDKSLSSLYLAFGKLISYSA
jgi:photosystem II stability/assembly factor-like uncharacterized protein